MTFEMRMVARAWAFAFHVLLSLTALGLAWLGFRGEFLHLPMFYAEGPRLNWWLLGCGIVGLATVLLALSGAVRWPLALWSLIVAVQLFRGWFLSSYLFATPAGFWWSVALTTAAALSFAFTLISKRRPRNAS